MTFKKNFFLAIAETKVADVGWLPKYFSRIDHGQWGRRSAANLFNAASSGEIPPPSSPSVRFSDISKKLFCTLRPKAADVGRPPKDLSRIHRGQEEKRSAANLFIAATSREIPILPRPLFPLFRAAGVFDPMLWPNQAEWLDGGMRDRSSMECWVREAVYLRYRRTSIEVDFFTFAENGERGGGGGGVFGD
jgi:hypothetical protein